MYQSVLAITMVVLKYFNFHEPFVSK